VVGDKRLGSGTSSNHVHHGSLNLEEAEGVQKPTQVADDLGTDDELLPDRVVDDQIEVPLTEASLLVLEAKVGLGKHVEARSEELNVLGEDGELATLGLAGVATKSNNVTTADNAVDVVKVLLGETGIAHHLDVDSLSVDVVENELALGALGHQATCTHAQGSEYNSERKEGQTEGEEGEERNGTHQRR